jgi:protein involved in polysaccharide export with SLBB domain
MMGLLSFLRTKRLDASIGTVFLIAFLIGCQSSPYPKQNPYLELGPVYQPRITLGPGDDIELQFVYLPRFNVSRTIQRDGKIQLPFVDTVMAQGKTPSELREELTRLYSEVLKNPKLMVITRSLAQDRVYVGGEVKEPATLDLSAHMTALEAIMRAGGFDMRSAKVKNVIIVRHKDGQRYGCALDFRDALDGKEAQPFYLEPYDIVWVPRTTIFKANQWIDQYINKMVPQTGFFYSYVTGGQTIGIDTDAYNVR